MCGAPLRAGRGRGRGPPRGHPRHLGPQGLDGARRAARPRGAPRGPEPLLRRHARRVRIARRHDREDHRRRDRRGLRAAVPARGRSPPGRRGGGRVAARAGDPQRRARAGLGRPARRPDRRSRPARSRSARPRAASTSSWASRSTTSTVMEQNSPPLEVLLDELDARARRATTSRSRTMPPGQPEGLRRAVRRLTGWSPSTSGRPRTRRSSPRLLPGMRICPSCGEQSPERMRCARCAARRSATVVARESRRTVTIVFAMPKVHSLTGEAAGPEAMRDVMSRYFDGHARRPSSGTAGRSRSSSATR